MKVAVILPAAGLGTRMGRSSAEKTGTSRKQFMLLDGSPILVHTVRKFAASDRVTEIVVSVRAEDVEWVAELLRGEAPGKPVRVVEGGNSRQESVQNGLRVLDPDTDLVAVHDAVRPFIDLETIGNVIDEATQTGAAIVGIVPVDTVKQVTRAQNARAKIRSTIPRDKLVLAQTPQVFRYNLLQQAFQAARDDGFTGTDESSLVERLEQVEVSVVPGSDRNIKITKPSDMDLARLFLEQDAVRRA
ncbi:MAG TPA: 2-C-methyl-D-erythritol 4-phosphate cytidylyltransferase, partial [Bryobacteraceae bacterium]|nr:2-C-methyl-D-erythritol 4-phosphate cytidylyltransferase [Bryobacteraceae bacterium]